MSLKNPCHTNIQKRQSRTNRKLQDNLKTSALSKILEKLFYKQLKETILSQKLLTTPKSVS